MECMNRKEPDSNDYMYENESVSDLVTIVSVAVLADDDEYDYYLMKVSKVPFQLERVENDDWGNTFPVGANVAGVIIITEGNKIHLNMNLFEAQALVARTTPQFLTFCLQIYFSMKFLYFFIISSLFPYFNLFVSIFIQYYVNIKLHVSTLYTLSCTR